MKLRYTLPLFVFMLLALRAPAPAGPGQDTGTTSEFWWEVELDMSVTGNYRFKKIMTPITANILSKSIQPGHWNRT